MADKIRTSVDLGNGGEGRQRLSRLQELAEQFGAIGQRGPSISNLLQMIADNEVILMSKNRVRKQIAGAVGVSVTDVEIDREGRVSVWCRSQYDAAAARSTLRSMGYDVTDGDHRAQFRRGNSWGVFAL